MSIRLYHDCVISTKIVESQFIHYKKTRQTSQLIHAFSF